MAPWTHLIRFIAEEDGQIHLGQVDPEEFPDIGIAVFEGKRISAKLVTGDIFDGVVSDTLLHVGTVYIIAHIANVLAANSESSSSHRSL
jgi:hypothetical protein